MYLSFRLLVSRSTEISGVGKSLLLREFRGLKADKAGKHVGNLNTLHRATQLVQSIRPLGGWTTSAGGQITSGSDSTSEAKVAAGTWVTEIEYFSS